MKLNNLKELVKEELDKETKYFNNDGFHPSDIGNILWCENILFPFSRELLQEGESPNYNDWSLLYVK